MTPLTIEEFEARVGSFAWRGRITAVHPHHTADPLATWRGEASVLSILAGHKARGFRDFAQHVTLDPHGMIWLGRDWNFAPASAVGHNGHDDGDRPFMIETFGNFLTDALEGAQRDNLIRIIAAVQDRFDLPPEAVMFHREMQATACPGNLDKAEIIEEVRAWRGMM